MLSFLKHPVEVKLQTECMKKSQKVLLFFSTSGFLYDFIFLLDLLLKLLL